MAEQEETTTRPRTKKNGKAEPAIAVAPTSSAAVPIVMTIPLDEIDESPTNPRKTFRGVEELADNVKEHGVLEPVLVRPHPTDSGRYELVFGARRFRASKLAGVRDIPAMVRTLSDAQALELQIVENAKREDIHPLEEADGYMLLHRAHDYSAEEIAKKVGKSVGTVLARLKLAALVPEAREAYTSGKLTLAAALVFARIPNVDVQAKAVSDILGSTKWHEDDDPLSERDIAWQVKRKYLLRLADAPFNRTDANLVDGAPACGNCPKRTGAQRELFGDLDGEKDDLCTDVACFDAKRDASWEKAVEAAKTKGQEVLTPKQAKSVFSYGGHVNEASGYVDLAEKKYGEDGKGKTYKSLLGKKDVAVVLARDSDGRVHELVDRKAFAKAVPEAKVKPTARKPAPAYNDAAWKKRQEREEAKRDKQEAEQRAAATEVGAKAEKKQPNDAFWRTLLRSVMRNVQIEHDTEEHFFSRLGIAGAKRKGYGVEAHPMLLEAASKMKADKARSFLVEFLCADPLAPKETLEEFRALYGVTSAKAAPKAKARA